MEPLVSVCCITYNHEKYIADALESFLMQKTEFPIEIIIHDDASTDNTANIIKKYEKKYPDIIRPIYQIENQYSKGKNPLRDFVRPLIKGKYAATCEGDDFWIETTKLQKQVEFLENNPDYIMCFHKVKVVNTNKEFTGRLLGLSTRCSKEISIKDMAKGGVVHISSQLIRSEVYKEPIPAWIKHAKHGDYANALFFAAEGRIYYIDEVMSAYRTGVKNSLMTNFRRNYTKESDIQFHKNRIEVLRMADKYYSYKYHDEIEKVYLLSGVTISLLKSDYSSTARKIYKKYLNYHGLISFIKLCLLKKCPALATLLVKLKDKISIARMNGGLDGR